MKAFDISQYKINTKIVKPSYLRNMSQALLFYKNYLNGKYTDNIIESIGKISKVRKNAKFTIVEWFVYDYEAMLRSNSKEEAAKYVRAGNSVYAVIKNQLGIFLCRADNLEVEYDINTVFYINGIKKLRKSGDVTVLIDEDNTKYKVRKDSEDEYDLEKAVAFLLLKREGYNLEDIYTMVDYLNK